MSFATNMLALYEDAEKKVLLGQSVQIGADTFTQADLVAIRRGRMEWERRVATEERQTAGDYDSARYQLADFTE